MDRKLIWLCMILVSVTVAQSVCTHEEGHCSDDQCVRGSNGAALGEGQSLVSGNGQYSLRMQHDGNLVIYCNNRPTTWSSSTNGIAINGGLRFQADGNLVLYRYNGQAVWNSVTAGTESCKLVMQNDGNLVLYGCYGTPYWNSGTANEC